MAALSPPVGYSAAELDAIFADLFTKAEQAKSDYLRVHTPADLMKYLYYYYANSPLPPLLIADVIASGIIKATPGKMIRLLVAEPGTSGSLTLNNATTVGGATGGNQVISYLFNGMTPGQYIDINFVCSAGIVVSACPVGGHYTLQYN